MSEMNIRNEEILLMGLCRLEFSSEISVMIKALTEEVTDWKYFAELANNHGVAALAYHNLEKYRLLDILPDEIILFLRDALMKSLSRNTFNLEAISEVLHLFNEAGIRTVLIKGLALELSVYGNGGLRQMTDVDLLITRKQCRTARQILISNGYVSLPFKSYFHKLIMAYTGKHLPSLMKKGTSVDLHTELFGHKRNVLTKLLYDTSYLLDIKGEKTFIPQPQILFLYLVKHLYQHELNNESQLRLYADLVVLIEKHREEILNYDLLTYAAQAGMSDILAWRLEPLRDLWGISFPDWINDFIDKWYNPDSINKFIFFLKSPKGNPPVDNAVSYRQVIRDIPGVHRKLLFLLGDIFPSLSFMKKRYNCPGSLKALIYYPHRFGKILWLFRR